MKIKPKHTTESDRVHGYRRMVEEDGGREHGLEVNSRSLDSIVHPNTLPMRHVIVPAQQGKPDSTVRARKGRFLGGSAAPEEYVMKRQRARADEMHEAAKHSPTVESFYRDSTLKHTAFTSKRRRNDQDED
jgi:hypothetical protein